MAGAVWIHDFLSTSLDVLATSRVQVLHFVKHPQEEHPSQMHKAKMRLSIGEQHNYHAHLLWVTIAVTRAMHTGQGESNDE